MTLVQSFAASAVQPAPPLRHFADLDPAAIARAFEIAPSPLSHGGSHRAIAVALGATLYMPATHPDLSGRLAAVARMGAVSAVVCLEDAVADHHIPLAERNLADQLERLRRARDSAAAPLLFVRARDPEGLERLARRLGASASVLAGVVFPKFRAQDATAWIGALDAVSARAGRPLCAMPILEGPEVLYRESRLQELSDIAEVLREHRSRVLAVRMGGTDLSGLLGLRRRADETIYDLAPVRDCIADVVNVLGRRGDGHVITGPVWEYFDRDGRRLDGLVKEASADMANGLLGKSVIHPSQIRAVNALLVPSLEEWTDAQHVLGEPGGVVRSCFDNKMNEARPHRYWAERVVERAHAFGVLRQGVSFGDLLAA